jgi:hypothetical protein
MFFDGEIYREWPEVGLNLNDEPVKVRRAVVKAWMDYLVPSSVGSKKFEFITQGRSLVEKKGGRYFSTCGELAMCALEVIGYRGSILNRTVDDKRYIPGQNMAWLMGHLGPGRRSRKEGAWNDWPGYGASIDELPGCGDIICVTEGPPRTEHVMVMLEHMNIDEDEEIDALYVAEAGRGGTYDQHCGFDKKDLIGMKVGGRTCVGSVDIGSLELTANAILPPEEEQSTS